MLKKTITYTDFDGNERTEDFYFNLTKAELTEMELSEQGGLQKVIERISAEKDSKKILEIFKKLILDAYGEKSIDGKRFIKSQELKDGFMQTNAYSDLFIELANDADKAADFINAIIPSIPQDVVPQTHPALNK